MISGIKTYTFPAGIFEIGEQFLVPEKTSIIGNQNPNNMVHPERSPDWDQQTLFLATRGVFAFSNPYCYADDMVTTRVGFVLSSDCSVSNLSYQGIDTIRPDDNGALCGGGAFETKGCAQNDCGGTVNNGGSDGKASVNVVISNVRINDYYFSEDESLIGAKIQGNQNCGNRRRTSSAQEQHERSRSVGHADLNCCFCQPNGVRASQVAVWVPETRDRDDGNWTENLLIENLVSRSTQVRCWLKQVTSLIVGIVSSQPRKRYGLVVLYCRLMELTFTAMYETPWWKMLGSLTLETMDLHCGEETTLHTM